MNQNQRYQDVLAKRFNAQGAGVADYSGPTAPGVGKEALEAAQLKSGTQQTEKAPEEMAQQATDQATGKIPGKVSSPSASPSGPSPAMMIGQAGMMSGNPYLMAGGLALSVVAQGESNRRTEEEAQRKAYNDKIAARQAQMSAIAAMGIQ
jgi:hypothetical protein